MDNVHLIQQTGYCYHFSACFLKLAVHSFLTSSVNITNNWLWTLFLYQSSHFISLILVYFIVCRQTSDPRSGFATVEKDLPGGLTPMLGDRKVCIILGL